MKNTLYKIVAGVTILSLVVVFFNYSYEKDSFSTDEALGAANLATFEVLGGGGGGGVIASSGGGGGGGGQYHKCVGQPLRQKSYTVIVGVGGTIDTTGETDSWITEYGSSSPLSLNADGGNGTSGVTAGTAGASGTTTGCAGTLTSYNGGTPGAGLTTNDTGGGGGGGAGYGGKGGNGAAASTTLTTIGGGGGGGAGTGSAGGNASSRNGGTAGTGGTGTGGAGGNGEANGTAGSAGSTTAMYITGGGGGGGSGGPTNRVGGACGAPGAGSGGGEVTGAGNGCRGEVRISYIDSEVNATGGTETTNGIYRIHTFTTSGTFTVTSIKSPATVALNSPAEASTTPDTTPELKFTGTDSLSADLRYHVQVDSVNTFDSQNGAWNIGSSTYATTSFNYSTQTSSANSIYFSPSGTTMYIIGTLSGSSTAKVFSYTLGTAWDVSTASYSLSTSTKNASAITFSSDGTKMYDFGSLYDRVYQYTLGTAWDVSSTASSTISTSTLWKSTNMDVLEISGDGTKMYTCDFTNGTIYQYTLGTAWDVSTASYSLSTTTGSHDNNCYSMRFSPDGVYMYIGGGTYDRVYQYTLGTAWDVSTSVYTREFYSPNIIYQQGIAFSADGKKMYSANSFTNTILFQYELANPIINSVSGSASGFSGTPDNTDPFTSGQEVVYTVQSALPEGTYYWRVKAGDPNGTNEYGSWSATRSFTISSGGGVSTPLYIEDVYFLQ